MKPEKHLKMGFENDGRLWTVLADLKKKKKKKKLSLLLMMILLF